MVTPRGLEPLLPPWKGGVLTAWPRGHWFIFFMVAANGVEPLTLRVWTVCSSQLSYAAMKKRICIFGCGSRIWTYDLRVMSPTSYQAAPSRDVSNWASLSSDHFKKWCRGPESNRYGRKDRRILSPVRLPVPPPRHFFVRPLAQGTSVIIRPSIDNVKLFWKKYFYLFSMTKWRYAAPSRLS